MEILYYNKAMTTPHMTTICYIEKEDSYLMLHRVKKQNDINKDKWIGIGGHFEATESPEDCITREVKEETGLTLLDYRFRGFVTFVFDDNFVEYMCLYTSDKFSGELIDCDEGNLEWINKKDLLTKELWEGDLIFLDLLDSNEPFFSLKLSYNKEGQLTEAVLNGKSMALPYHR